MRVRHTYVARGPWGGGAAAPGVRGQQNNGCEERTGSSAWNACHLAHLPCSQAAPRRRVGGAERGTVRPAAGSPREPTRAGTGQPRRLGIILSFHRVYQPGPVRAAAPQARTPLRDRSRARGSRRAGVRGIRSVRGTKQRVHAAMRVRQCFPIAARQPRGTRGADWRFVSDRFDTGTVVPPSSGPPTKAPRY